MRGGGSLRGLPREGRSKRKIKCFLNEHRVMRILQTAKMSDCDQSRGRPARHDALDVLHLACSSAAGCFLDPVLIGFVSRGNENINVSLRNLACCTTLLVVIFSQLCSSIIVARHSLSRCCSWEGQSFARPKLAKMLLGGVVVTSVILLVRTSM